MAFCYIHGSPVENVMTLLEKCALLAHNGETRDQIAIDLMLSRQMVDWLMDSDSFAVVLERVSGVEREDS
jgi:orotate phosphoribosyltransferase-like protein